MLCVRDLFVLSGSRKGEGEREREKERERNTLSIAFTQRKHKIFLGNNSSSSTTHKSSFCQLSNNAHNAWAPPSPATPCRPYKPCNAAFHSLCTCCAFECQGEATAESFLYVLCFDCFPFPSLSLFLSLFRLSLYSHMLLNNGQLIWALSSFQ